MPNGIAFRTPVVDAIRQSPIQFKHNKSSERNMFPAHLIRMYRLLKENSNNNNASSVWRIQYISKPFTYFQYRF